MSWVSDRDLAAEARVRFFCLPHAGSGAAAFFRWKRLLPASVAVCPLMLPGRELRLGEEPVRNISTMVSALHKELRRHLDMPYAIFGHSMGALIAFEWTCLIQLEGLPLPRTTFLSGRNAPQAATVQSALHCLGDEEMVRQLGRRYGGNSDVLLSEPDLRNIFLPTLRADLEAVETYECGGHLPLRCPVRAYAGNEDMSVTDAGLDGWSAKSSASFSTRRFRGDHFYHLGTGQQGLIAEIASELED